ncbi:DUF3572 domain-containing protein [Pseudorhizobium pelagicum]|uniref:DUF3572 domain-containing protein n=1 Tax=Pseudorhizobium pelagicum TaxID=1509405 RepID=A0A922T9J5_9HYPH|nr:DUF3572 domain-containing protein [Pseudorhizobium pelagicum]KEQ06822.1 hypothetical protein GV67_24210 [Pseudorhizobium pelagicum]KEQ08665.1 hypothetical protein GV68_26075 [Pseudorhizobium pelagicum]
MPRDPKNVSHGAESAEQTAVAILAWLASEPEMLSRFLALTGLEASQLRGAVADPGFLGGMIDFLMGHEPTLLAFCEATETRPEAVEAAWRYYSGPGLDSGEY